MLNSIISSFIFSILNLYLRISVQFQTFFPDKEQQNLLQFLLGDIIYVLNLGTSYDFTLVLLYVE
jgi:hypothetical protein